MIQANIALSGGGSRGVAHVGVLKALHEFGIEPAAMSGTSAGSIVGAFICDGFTIEEIIEIIRRFEYRNKINFQSFRTGTGFFSMDPVVQLLKRNLRSKNIEELRLPLYVTAADFNTGKPHMFSEGSIIERVVASCSIPIVFPPVYIDGIPYVDGGLSCNLPVDAFMSSSKKIVGVNVNPVVAYRSDLGFWGNMDRTLNLFVKESGARHQLKCHVFVEPKGLEKFYLFDSKHMHDMIEIAYTYVISHINKEDVLEKLRE